MQIKILSPLWGHESWDIVKFLDKIKAAGYDGIDTWVPEDKVEKARLYDGLQKNELSIVTHQHEAYGKDFTEFKTTFKKQLAICAEPAPILINSHTGRDYFSFQQNFELIEIASEFSAKTGIVVAHETHRGRLGYCPQMMAEFFINNKDFLITADFSHWVCTTESMLENFSETLHEAIIRARHIHARVGFEEGPQVPDPRAPEWQYAVDHFLSWWDKIITHNIDAGTAVFPITTEFGPQPYMPSIPFTNQPVADQFSVNCYMKDLIRKRYCSSGEKSLLSDL